MEWYLLNEMPSNHIVTISDIIISVFVGVAMITALIFILRDLVEKDRDGN